MSKRSDLNWYLVGNKEDDYGNSIIELVETTPELAKEYYWKRETRKSDFRVLKKYFEPVYHDEEKERTDDRRFYGTVEE